MGKKDIIAFLSIPRLLGGTQLHNPEFFYEVTPLFNRIPAQAFTVLCSKVDMRGNTPIHNSENLKNCVEWIGILPPEQARALLKSKNSSGITVLEMGLNPQILTSELIHHALGLPPNTSSKAPDVHKMFSDFFNGLSKLKGENVHAFPVPIGEAVAEADRHIEDFINNMKSLASQANITLDMSKMPMDATIVYNQLKTEVQKLGNEQLEKKVDMAYKTFCVEMCAAMQCKELAKIRDLNARAALAIKIFEYLGPHMYGAMISTKKAVEM